MLKEEKAMLGKIMMARQEDRPVVKTPLVVTAALLGVGVRSIFSSALPRKQLTSHPMCGITTGGKVSNKQRKEWNINYTHVRV